MRSRSLYGTTQQLTRRLAGRCTTLLQALRATLAAPQFCLHPCCSLKFAVRFMHTELGESSKSHPVICRRSLRHVAEGRSRARSSVGVARGFCRTSARRGALWDIAGLANRRHEKLVVSQMCSCRGYHLSRFTIKFPLLSGPLTKLT